MSSRKPRQRSSDHVLKALARAKPRAQYCQNSLLNYKNKNKRAGEVAQVVEYLPSKRDQYQGEKKRQCIKSIKTRKI
jgi:hypothetical protein